MALIGTHSNPMVAGLLASRDFPDRPVSVELVETHISYLFLTGRYVYKVRKAVDFGFLDFSTLEKRYQDCQREVELNRRLSPDVYHGIVEIRKEDDSYSVEGGGEAVEYAVQMRQLPRGCQMNVLLDRGEVAPDMVERIARKIAAFHKRAERGERIIKVSGYPAVQQNVLENFSQTERYVGHALPEAEYLDLKAYAKAFLEERRSQLEQRASDGWMRDCHGDLHSAQIFVEDGIHIIDCIEFNERFRYCDTVADIAFLAMDMDYHGRSDLSKVLIDAYQDEIQDPGLPCLLDFYKTYRAYVRCKVTCFRLDIRDLTEAGKREATAIAQRYLHLAHSYVWPAGQPRLVVVLGLTGTGKTRLAGSLAKLMNGLHISSDEVRKELANVPAIEHHYVGHDTGIYSPDMTRRTYVEMHRRAGGLLATGKSVILDGTYRSASFREEALSVAKSAGVQTTFIYCTASEAIVKQRLDRRLRQPHTVSDGRCEIYLRQKDEFEPLVHEHMAVDTSGEASESLFQALQKLHTTRLKEECIG
jgi:aminoglycoside phosphotransferase family enzyme/predicted kinase